MLGPRLRMKKKESAPTRCHTYSSYSSYLHLLLVPGLQVVSNVNTGNQTRDGMGGGVVWSTFSITDHL